MNEKEMALLVHYTMRNHIGAMALKDGEEREGYKNLYQKMKEERSNAVTVFRKLRNAEKDLDKLLGKKGRFDNGNF